MQKLVFVFLVIVIVIVVVFFVFVCICAIVVITGRSQLKNQYCTEFSWMGVLKIEEERKNYVYEVKWTSSEELQLLSVKKN